MLCVLGITVLLGLLLLDHNRDTTLPTPTGPFAVGRTRYAWSDASQADPLAPQPRTKRELLAWDWYPAAPVQQARTVDDYLPAPWRTAIEGQSGVLLTQFLTRDLSRVHAHSIRDAEVSPQQHSYPVVLMRTGGAALTTDFTSLADRSVVPQPCCSAMTILRARRASTSTVPPLAMSSPRASPSRSCFS